jgi:hypothetical protein
MTAYALARRIGDELRDGTLEFSTVDRLVADSPRSALFRLKEDCHALFREPEPRQPQAPRPEELFDLAVGALFHEAMKFRESCYLYTDYGPRAQRSFETSASGLAEGFRRLFDAAHRRMLESEAETEELFAETRQQLRVLLQGWACSGEVARGLVAEPALTERVFEAPLGELLEEIFGSAPQAYAVALRSLLSSGHYLEASSLLEQEGMPEEVTAQVDQNLVRGLATYYEGNPCGALHSLDAWVRAGARAEPQLRARACSVLRLVAYEMEDEHPSLGAKAEELEKALRQPGS